MGKYVAGIVVLVIFFVFIKIKQQLKEANYLNDILYNKKEPNKFVEEMDRILSKNQTEKNKVINTIQKTTGLLYAGKFNEVVEILDSINNAPKNWLPIYYQNLVLSLYFKKDKNRANDVFKRSKPIFEEYKKNQYYKDFIEIVYSVSDFYNGKGSKGFYYDLSETGENDYRKALGYYFLGMINKKEKQTEEMEKSFNKAIEYGKGSFIEKFAKEQ